jgi:hypothetical protein
MQYCRQVVQVRAKVMVDQPQQVDGLVYALESFV